MTVALISAIACSQREERAVALTIELRVTQRSSNVLEMRGMMRAKVKETKKQLTNQKMVKVLPLKIHLEHWKTQIYR